MMAKLAGKQVTKPEKQMKKEGAEKASSSAEKKKTAKK